LSFVCFNLVSFQNGGIQEVVHLGKVCKSIYGDPTTWVDLPTICGQHDV
jgi:hypothetical protein